MIPRFINSSEALDNENEYYLVSFITAYYNIKTQLTNIRFRKYI